MPNHISSLIVSLGLFRSSGGPAKTIKYFRDGLDARLLNFVTERETRDQGPLAIDNTVPVLSKNLPIFNYLRSPSADSDIRAQAMLRNADMVSCHAFYRSHALWVRRHCNAMGKPYWFVPHGILDPWVMESMKWGKRLYLNFGGKSFLSDASAVIFSTKREQEKANASFNLPSKQYVIYWPVESVDRARRFAARERLRRNLGISESDRVLVYFGRLHSMKRPLETIKAFSEVANKRADWHLIMIGSDADVSKDICRRAARKYHVDKNVHVLGSIYGPEKYEYLMAADGYVSLSYRENFNHTACEAMACGLPVVLSPGNDLSYDLLNRGVGWFPASDACNEIKRALTSFFTESQKKVEQMGQVASKWVSVELNVDNFNNALIKARSELFL